MGDVLHNERVVGAGAKPGRWLYVLHGIYGAGRNWRSVARKLVEVRPDWGAVLIDLREHGQSQGLNPPHTIASAADDLSELSRVSGPVPAAVLGHSFGGKVALMYAWQSAEAGASSHPAAPLRQVWLIDSTPAPRIPGGSAWAMLQVLRRCPARFDSRGAGVRALVAGGVAPQVAEWMVTNLEYRNGEYAWRLDLDSMEALLRDFFRTDLWRVVERPPGGVAIHVVQASESSVLDAEAVERILAAGRAGHPVYHHVVHGGHWLNADNPDALIDLLRRELPANRSRATPI